MAVEIIKTITQQSAFAVPEFQPPCQCWQQEFGEQVNVKPDGSGIVPDAVYLKKRRFKDTVYLPLSLPWKFCPVCGQELEIIVTEVVVRGEAPAGAAAEETPITPPIIPVETETA